MKTKYIFLCKISFINYENFFFFFFFFFFCNIIFFLFLILFHQEESRIHLLEKGILKSKEIISKENIFNKYELFPFNYSELF